MIKKNLKLSKTVLSIALLTCFIYGAVGQEQNNCTLLNPNSGIDVVYFKSHAF